MGEQGHAQHQHRRHRQGAARQRLVDRGGRFPLDLRQRAPLRRTVHRYHGRRQNDRTGDHRSRQRYASTSGEVRVSRSMIDGPRLHTLHATIRARSLDSFYGGAAPALDLGPREFGAPGPIAPPVDLRFGNRNHDRVRQTTVGVAYEGRWKGVGEVGIAIQRADYSKTIDQPGLPRTGTIDRPWLLNASAAALITDRFALLCELYPWAGGKRDRPGQCRQPQRSLARDPYAAGGRRSPLGIAGRHEAGGGRLRCRQALFQQ